MRRGNARRRLARERGSLYLAVLFGIALTGIGLAVVGQVWQTAREREREAELLFVGNQYRQAIGAYFRQVPPGRYPPRLEDLLKDPRTPHIARYLRQLYADPITGKAEWGFVRGSDGGIAGVYSLSEKEPLKSANFRLRDAAFEGRKKYSEWQFSYAPGLVGAPFPAPAPAPK
jgi:type II secretory pathway pseudopilin PulG